MIHTKGVISMKKLNVLLAVLALLSLLCGCKDRTEASDATTETPAVQTAESTTASAAEPNAGQTEPDAVLASTAGEDLDAGKYALIDSDRLDDIPELHTTAPTIGLPTPVEPPLGVEDVELPPDDLG